VSWLAFALGYAGVALLAFAMTPHHRAVFGRVAGPRRVFRFRIAGSALLVAAFTACVLALGIQVGLIGWIAMLSVSGFFLTQLLAFAPRCALLPAVGLLLSALVTVFDS
jgi:hypothetical protein